MILVVGGCSSQPTMRTPVSHMAAGQYGVVRTDLYRELTHDRKDRDYVLQRVRLGAVTLADGYAASARTVLMDVYDVLRTQGVNRGRGAQTVLLNEDVRTWKGEPYEQALAMLYVAMAAAQLGEWDNARAAAANARTMLADLQGEALPGEATVQQRARLYERALAEGATPAEAKRRANQTAAPGYTRDTTFALACVLGAVANQQLGVEDEADAYFARAVELNPDLKPAVDRMRAGDYNTLYVVGYGLAPEKELHGADESTVAWRARTAGDRRALAARVDDGAWQDYPVAEDVNRLATFYNWNQFADLRAGKSTLGDLFILGGAGAAVIGGVEGSGEAVGAGLGALLFGAVMKAGAHGDPRYNDLLPQRYYVVPLTVQSPDERITFQLGDATLVISGLSPSRDAATFRYLQLPSAPGRWATTGKRYPFDPPPDAPTMIEDTDGYAGRHILEGGDSAVAPDPGTVADARLFGLPRLKYKENAP